MTRLAPLNVGLFALLLWSLASSALHGQVPARELAVHLVQANNHSPYAFVRAKFEPGELSDPWAVRFFDQNGREVQYFVWDSVTWQVAREGRADWGRRYALLNHHPGNAPEALEMRPRRIDAAREQLPQLGASLAAQDEAAKQAGDSVCAALYLVRHAVPALGKDKLTLRVYPMRQVEPKQRRLEADRARQRVAAAAGDLVVDNFPDKLAVRWKEKELFRYGGFKIGDKSLSKDGSFQAASHVDPMRPLAIEIAEGIITKVTIHGATDGRAGGAMNWQCVYWLFPEGSFVALKGFNLENTEGYLGGGLTMAIWEMPRQPQELHQPLWKKPWWLFELDDDAFVALHQCPDVPLAVGYGNNPFCASTPGSFAARAGERTKGQGDGLVELNWTYDLTDNRIYRLFHPRLDGDRSFDLAEVTDLRDTLLGSGKLTKVPTDATDKEGRPIWPPERVAALEEALSLVKWRPRFDWLYRQYLVGVGQTASDAETGIRQVLGAAAGWVDRPFQEEELAELIVQFSLRQSSNTDSGRHQQAWTVLPAVLHKRDRQAARQFLGECADPVEMAADAMQRIRKCAAGGADPILGTTKEGGEGWLHNPAYAAVDVPVALRFMEHFRLFDLADRPRREYREALLEWADFSLEVVGGSPLDGDKLRASYRSAWANRMVMLGPLMLRAYQETSDEKYARAARMLFEEVLMKQVEQSPHGYFWAWGHAPQQAEPFDLNYNVAAYDRGIVDFWSEEQLDVIGRERGSKFVAAQARYLAFSGQLLDTLETDNMTALASHYPGQIPFAIGQVAPLLYDDFPFYRGLVGDIIRWGVIDDGATVARREGRRNLYAMKIGTRGTVFWAYGIGRDTPPASKTARNMLER